MKIFIVTGISESGDVFDPKAFTKRPDDETKKRIAHEWDGNYTGLEGFDGPGDYGSYMYLETYWVELEEN